MTYVNEKSVLAVGVVFIILSPLAVFCRFHARKKLGLGIDEYLCVPALVCDNN